MTSSQSFFTFTIAAVTVFGLITVFTLGAVFRAGFIAAEGLLFVLLPRLWERWRWRRRQRWV